MNEPAGRWLRVSSGGQDEANQEPDIDKWCVDHDYDVRATYRLHGKSASKGKHQKSLDQVIADMERGLITVLVVWQSSRIERRGAYSIFDLFKRVKEAGGRIEFVQDAHLNGNNEMSDVMLALAATTDRQKSRNISKSVGAAHIRIKENGALGSREAFGLTSVGEKYHRQLVPTDLGREWVPRIFDQYLRGTSMRQMAEWLNASNVPTDAKKTTGWSASSVRRVLRNPTYIGRRCEWDPKTGYGKTTHRCEPLIPTKVFDRVQALIDAKPKTGPRTGDRPMLSGVLFCMLCGAKMYRRTVMKQPNNWYYRCEGHYPARRSSCQNMPRGDNLDDTFSALMAQWTAPIEEKKLIPGRDYASELLDVQRDIKELADRNLNDDEYDDELRRLRTERDRLAAKKVVPDRWERTTGGETYAEKWARLTNKERTAWLQEKDMKIYAWAGHKEGDKELLLAAIGQPGCAITTPKDLPRRINGIYLLADLTPLMEAAETEDGWQKALEELTRLTALGRSEWAVANPALVLAA